MYLTIFLFVIINRTTNLNLSKESETNSTGQSSREADSRSAGQYFPTVYETQSIIAVFIRVCHKTVFLAGWIHSTSFDSIPLRLGNLYPQSDIFSASSLVKILYVELIFQFQICEDIETSRAVSPRLLMHQFLVSLLGPEKGRVRLYLAFYLSETCLSFRTFPKPSLLIPRLWFIHSIFLKPSASPHTALSLNPWRWRQ